MSYLIFGGTAEERYHKALKIVKERQIAKFDILIVTGETSIGIGQVRTLFHQFFFKPYGSPAKAAIIHPGEILTIEAQNALLKTLEETGDNTIIILTAPQPEFLLPTVVSRCQIIRLPTKSEIVLTREEFDSVFRLLSSVFRGRVGERLKIASELGKQREEISNWLEKLLYFLHEVLLFKKGNPNPEYVNMLTRCQTKSNLLATQIVKIIRSLGKIKAMIEQNINPRLALEVFLLDLPKLNS